MNDNHEKFKRLSDAFHAFPEMTDFGYIIMTNNEYKFYHGGITRRILFELVKWKIKAKFNLF